MLLFLDYWKYINELDLSLQGDQDFESIGTWIACITIAAGLLRVEIEIQRYSFILDICILGRYAPFEESYLDKCLGNVLLLSYFNYWSGPTFTSFGTLLDEKIPPGLPPH